MPEDSVPFPAIAVKQWLPLYLLVHSSMVNMLWTRLMLSLSLLWPLFGHIISPGRLMLSRYMPFLGGSLYSGAEGEF